MLISFDMPIMTPQRTEAELKSDERIVKLEREFAVEVKFPSPRGKVHSSLVLVKGAESNAINVRTAARFLIIYLCGTVS